jgi:hypothetical protein
MTLSNTVVAHCCHGFRRRRRQRHIAMINTWDGAIVDTLADHPSSTHDSSGQIMLLS